MVRITGWNAKIKSHGAWYPRYRNRTTKTGLEYRNTNTHMVIDSSGKVIGVEHNLMHTHGDDKVMAEVARKRKKIITKTKGRIVLP